LRLGQRLVEPGAGGDDDLVVLMALRSLEVVSIGVRSEARKSKGWPVLSLRVSPVERLIPWPFPAAEVEVAAPTKSHLDS